MNKQRTLLAELLCGDDQRAEIAARDLAFHGAESLPALQTLLVSGDPETRWWAVRALAVIRHPRVPPLLRRSLQDPDVTVRQCAALALHHQPTPQAIPDLVTCLSAEDRLLAHLAADALIAIGEEAVPDLLKSMENGSQAARLEATRALALIGDQRAIPALFAALDDESALVAHWVDEGLERMGVGMTFFKPGG